MFACVVPDAVASLHIRWSKRTEHGKRCTCSGVPYCGGSDVESTVRAQTFPRVTNHTPGARVVCGIFWRALYWRAWVSRAVGEFREVTGCPVLSRAKTTPAFAWERVNSAL